MSEKRKTMNVQYKVKKMVLVCFHLVDMITLRGNNHNISEHLSELLLFILCKTFSLDKSWAPRYENDLSLNIM